MKKTIFLSLVIGIFVSTMMVAAENSDEPSQKTIKLKKGYVLIKKTGSEEGSVTFFHRKHKKWALEEKKCKTCHHIGKWKQSCSDVGCHDDPTKDSEGDRIHATCLNRCHAEKGDKTPTDCIDCHK